MFISLSLYSINMLSVSYLRLLSLFVSSLFFLFAQTPIDRKALDQSMVDGSPYVLVCLRAMEGVFSSDQKVMLKLLLIIFK
jgi:hypothetical protein